jgi:hypothetical protein
MFHRIRTKRSAALQRRDRRLNRSSRQGRQVLLLLVKLRRRTTRQHIRRHRLRGLWRLRIRRPRLRIQQLLLLSSALRISRRPKKRKSLANGQDRTSLSFSERQRGLRVLASPYSSC